MDTPSPMLGVAAGPPPKRPEAVPLPLPTPAAAAPSWPRSAQWATAALLLLVLALLAWNAAGMLRWGGRPTELTAAQPRIDLNHADRAQLLQLPHVGDITAGHILEYRESHGGFRSVDELRQVRGVGACLIETIRPLIEVRPNDADDVRADGPLPPPPTPPKGHRAVAPKADKPAARAPRTTKKKGDGPAEPININTATAEELEQLPHVGPAIAARIIAAREERPFQSVDDLRRVKGIGKGKTILEDLRPFVTVR